MRKVKRAKKVKRDVLMDDYEFNVKYIATKDTRLSMGYDEFSVNEDVDMDDVGGMEDIDYLFEDVIDKKTWELSEV